MIKTCEKCNEIIKEMTDEQQKTFLSNKNNVDNCGLANRSEIEICVPLLRLIVEKNIIQ